jgi:NAD(P)-dependent dehydrogenase (short-subunit alcohol dehydrogenase family)
MTESSERLSGPRRPENAVSWLALGGATAAVLFGIAKLASRVRKSPVNLRGKVALVTGGSRGLGLALAQELGDYGCQIALCARDAAELEQAAEKMREWRVEVDTFACDLSKEEEIEPLIGRVLARFGRIDILVNNAGLIQVAPFDNLEKDDFEKAMDLMFWGPVNLTLAVLPHMRRQGGGHVVNITSVGGRVAVPHLLPYSCAKFAFVGFSTGLSAELSPDDVHVMTVVPGLMRTGSYLNVPFKGQSSKEFAWFGLLGNLPGFSVSADFAARSIRESLQRRQATCTISLPARVLIHAEALLPEATRTIMQLTNELLLPGANAGDQERTGKALNPKFGALFQALTRLGQVAASGLNQ